MKFQDLLKRTIYGLTITLIISLLLAFFSKPPVRFLITMVCAGLGALSMWEFMRLGGVAREKRGYRNLLMILVSLVIAGFFVSTIDRFYAFLPFLLFFLASIILFFYQFNKIDGSLQLISQGFFGLIYIGLPLGFMLKILYFSNHSTSLEIGRYFFIYLLVVTKIADIGAYFGGRFFGNRKLAKKISPKKTVEGGIAGFLMALLSSLLFYAIGLLVPNLDFPFVSSLCLGVAIGLIGQFGDLAESVLKRDAGIKDSNSLPGLGGVLDMLDSLFFTTPALYLFLYFFR